MCMKGTCQKCCGATWWGCGNHIAGVLDHIPSAKWCTCEPRVQSNGKSYPPMGPKDQVPAANDKPAKIHAETSISA